MKLRTKIKWRLIDDYARDGGKELFTKMHCVLVTNLNDSQPGSNGQLPTLVLTLVPARSNSQFDWLFDNKRLSNYSKVLLIGFGEKLVNFGSLSRKNRTKD